MDPQRRVRRNLRIFWLVLVGTPLLIFASCVALGIKPCCTDSMPPAPAATPTPSA